MAVMVDVPDKANVFGVNVSVTDYAEAASVIVERGVQRQSFGVSALAVHGLITATQEDEFRDVVNSIDLVTPDGQPVRWAMNFFHGAGLPDAVSGPELTWEVLEAAEAADVGVYLFGSTEETAQGFADEIVRRHPNIRICGVQPDRFRDATPEEDAGDISRINASGAGIVLVGRGCPRQERWVAAHVGKVDAALLAVGAAFDFGAGNLSRPPEWVRRYGLHWAYRLAEEPGRLWKRYLKTNSLFLAKFVQATPKAMLARVAGRRGR